MTSSTRQLPIENAHNSEIERTGTTLSGKAPHWRIIAVVYSSKNMFYKRVEPKLKMDGSYDLSDNGVLLTISEAAFAGATNYDFFTYSEPGDPWYGVAGGASAERPWLHASEGGKEKMKLLATDNKGIKAEKDHNHSGFDRLYYIVAPRGSFRNQPSRIAFTNKGVFNMQGNRILVPVASLIAAMAAEAIAQAPKTIPMAALGQTCRVPAKRVGRWGRW